MGNIFRPYADIMTIHDGVTGSATLITAKFPDKTKKEILIDCGLFQEQEYLHLNNSLPFSAENVDYVFVTHNHVDHTGRLPFLVKNGYRGKIYTSFDTSVLISKALEDSYTVIKNKAKLHNEAPLYSDGDVFQTLNQVDGLHFEESIQIDRNIKTTLFKSGHIPGAAIILLQFKFGNSSLEHCEDLNLLFTGDYHYRNTFFDVTPIPEWVHELPISIIQEATYGNMSSNEIEYVFEKNILEATNAGKEIVVLAFSLGRFQEILYLFKLLQKEGKLDKNIPIYLDGKLAMSYTGLFMKGMLDIHADCIDLLPENVDYVLNSVMRRSIMKDNQPKIILTTSGMGSYGPAQTYLPTYLKNPNALIHFTGYCAEGTLGRRLYDCELGENTDISGLKVKKLADVKFTSEFSAHAKNDDLLNFLRPFKDLKFVGINHGEYPTKDYYANLVVDQINAQDVAVLGRDYVYRLDGSGLVRPLSSKLL